jgi:dihydroorotate dehydrogenase electron transfer subunit
MNKPIITKIVSISNETSDIRSIKFTHPSPITPGQFYMIWIPGIDEIPMSVSFIEDEVKGITFRNVGDATNNLFSLKRGDKIGIRGPYGNGFSFKGKKILIVGGGTGIAMITPMVEQCIEKGLVVDVVLGVKSKEELFFVDRIQKTNATMHLSTDDGSEGFCGFASDCAYSIIKQKQIDMIYTCGPELMMKCLFDIAKKEEIAFEASLERYMKCAVGICGQCCIGNGLRVCVEGPVFSRDILDSIIDFGNFTRDATGMKIKL